jgi:DNA topoisomerase IA
MTQDLISNMLGVRREGITHAAKRLQNAGYISYVRGDMTILNRKGLEMGVCECYQVVRTEYDRLLEQITPPQLISVTAHRRPVERTRIVKG